MRPADTEVMSAAGADFLLDRLPDAVLVIDEEGVLRSANAAAETIFGWPVAEWVGRSLLELIHPEDLEMAVLSLGTVTGKDVGTPIEVRARSADGWRLVEVIGGAFDDDGEGFVALCVRDLTERRRWEVAGDDTAMFRSIMQNAASLTLLADAHGVVRAASAALIRITGRDPEEVIGRPLSELVAEADHRTLRRSVDCLVAGEDRRASVEVTLVGEVGHSVPCQLTIVDLLDDPTVEGLVVSGHDISELQKARQELEHLARHDALTGLANRTHLTRELARRLPRTETDSHVAVAFVDLDRFKPVNDLYGHDAGDELLIEVAARLESVVREGDMVARFGGDEFVVVAVLDGPADAHRLRNRIDRALARPFGLSVGTVHVPASVGVVLADPGDEVETVIAEADAAMYAAKNLSGGSDPTQRTVAARPALADRLGPALDAGEFVVHYEPIVDLETGHWIGLEALARWDHPERGMLLPADFVDVVQNVGLSGRLGEIVTRITCDDMRSLHRATGARSSLAVDASIDEITDPEFPSLVAETLRWGESTPIASRSRSPSDPCSSAPCDSERRR